MGCVSITWYHNVKVKAQVQAWWTSHLMLAQETELVDFCEFEVRMAFVRSSVTARVHVKTVSQKGKNTSATLMKRRVPTVGFSVSLSYWCICKVRQQRTLFVGVLWCNWCTFFLIPFTKNIFGGRTGLFDLYIHIQVRHIKKSEDRTGTAQQPE